MSTYPQASTLSRLYRENQVSLNGIVFNIQRFSIHDGPGIRTTVFLKGCALRCFWCHNPEGLRIKPEIQFFPDRCIACGECVTACEHNAQELDGTVRSYHRERCVVCGQCIETCFAEGLQMTGKAMSVDEVFNEIQQDQAFYQASGGGVTLSGGEPLLQLAFSQALLARCRVEGIPTAIETTAHCKWEDLETILPVTDLVMMDIKHMDPEKHRAATGVSNERILENAARLAQNGYPLIFRTPVVPGVNDSVAEIAAIARFIQQITLAGQQNGHYPVVKPSYELLTFHQLAASKYHSLGLDYRSAGMVPPTRENMHQLEEAAEQEGVAVLVR
jgi:pyruvate formate lyase activating enzyme